MVLDIIQNKVDMINNKNFLIVDKEIEEYLITKELNLTATTDIYRGYNRAEFIIISTTTNYDSEKSCFNTSTVET